MNDAWAPPEAAGVVEEPPLTSPLEDVHVVVTVVLLLSNGLPMLLLGLTLPVMGVVLGLVEPQPDGVFLASLGIFEGLCIGVMGVLYTVGGFGLVRPKPWAWIVGLVAVAFWMSSPCCLPMGAYGLYALLRERVRVVYGLG